MRPGRRGAGDGAVGGLAPQRLLGAVDGEAVDVRRTARRASRRGRAGRGRAAAAWGYQPFSSAIGWPSASRTRSSRQAWASAPSSSAAATSAGGRSSSTPSSRVDGVSPRRRMSWLNDARCSRLSSRGRATKVPLAVDPVQQAVGDQAVDGLAHRRPGHGVRRHQLALGGDRGVRGQLAGGQLGQRVAQLGVLGAGARQRRSGWAHFDTEPLDKCVDRTGTFWYVPVDHEWYAPHLSSTSRSRVETSTPTQMAREIAEQPAAVRAHPGRAAAAAGASSATSRPAAGGCCSRPAGPATTPRSTAATCSRPTPASLGGLVSPSVATHYRSRLDLSDAVVVSVSQSGATEEIVATQAWARECGAATVAVANVADSPLVEAADLALVTQAGAGARRTRDQDLPDPAGRDGRARHRAGPGPARPSTPTWPGSPTRWPGCSRTRRASTRRSRRCATRRTPSSRAAA